MVNVYFISHTYLYISCIVVPLLLLRPVEAGVHQPNNEIISDAVAFCIPPSVAVHDVLTSTAGVAGRLTPGTAVRIVQLVLVRFYHVDKVRHCFLLRDWDRLEVPCQDLKFITQHNQKFCRKYASKWRREGRYLHPLAVPC